MRQTRGSAQQLGEVPKWSYRGHLESVLSGKTSPSLIYGNPLLSVTYEYDKESFPPYILHIMAPDQRQDSARSRSDPSDQRTLSCRVGTLLGSSVWSEVRAGPRAAAGRRPAHAGAAPRRGGRCPRDRVSLPSLDDHKAGVRVPGVDGGAIRRSAPGDVGRNGPGRGRLDHPRRSVTDEGLVTADALASWSLPLQRHRNLNL